jgi:hypothetical protein
VTGLYCQVKKELLEGIPGTRLNDFCGSGKSVIATAFLFIIYRLYQERNPEKYKHYTDLQTMDTRPTLILFPSMIPGWVQKFDENLEAIHPLRITYYHNLAPMTGSFNEIIPYSQ